MKEETIAQLNDIVSGASKLVAEGIEGVYYTGAWAEIDSATQEYYDT